MLEGLDLDFDWKWEDHNPYKTIQLSSADLSRMTLEEYDKFVTYFEPLDKSERRINSVQRRQIRNRMSAARCRKRKNDELERLREENNRLRKELKKLKGSL